MKQFFKNVFATAIGLFVGTVLMLLILPVIIAVLMKAMQGGVQPIKEKSVLHLDLHGRLVEKARPLDFDFFSRSPFSEAERSTGLFELTEALTLAKNDPRISGIYLELHQLEAGWASVEALRRAILDFSKSGKFIYAYSEILDERTYYLATSAQKIFLQPNGEMEFNGLAVSEAFLKGLFDKLEIQPRIFRVGKFKAAVEPLVLDKMSEENRAQNQVLVNDIWNVARTAYQQPGKIKGEDIDRLAAGLEVMSSEDAREAGLVHELAFEDQVLDMLAERTVGKDEDARFVTPSQVLGEAKLRPSIGHRDKIAVIFAEGEIVSGSGDLSSIGSETFVEDLDEARSDESVKAIVVRINSPGGDALASDVIWRELAITDKEIPVVASMGDVAASGGYYMAAGARHIFAEASTITGSIGVFGILFNSENFFRNKLGVNFDRVVTHPYADIGDPNREMTEFERAKIQAGVERVYSRFLNVVRERRRFPPESDLSEIAEGRVWSGQSAQRIRLVDEIGGLKDAVGKAAELAQLKDAYDLDIYPRAEEPLRRLLQLISGEAVSVALKGTPLESLGQHLPRSLTALKSGIYARLPFDLKLQ